MRFLPVRHLPLALSALLLAGCGTSSNEMPDAGSQAGPVTLGVNSYLWRASLDTLSFMPLASSDPVGGILNFDWYSAPDNPNERMKVTVFILDRRLRADGIRVSVFRQSRTSIGWVDADVNPDTANKLTDAILTRARELRLASQPAG
jgi:hypothetical protein